MDYIYQFKEKHKIKDSGPGKLNRARPLLLTDITINEIKEGKWGIGGQAITSKKVAEHAKKNTKS